jgi:hypothetical protein
MKANYTTRNGRYTFEVEGSTHVELFKQLAEIQEVYEGLTCSYGGKTSEDVILRVRTVEDNDFLEAVCVSSDFDLRNARLSFGQAKKGGGIFPKRKNEDGSYNKNNGWKKWNADKKVEE